MYEVPNDGMLRGAAAGPSRIKPPRYEQKDVIGELAVLKYKGRHDRRGHKYIVRCTCGKELTLTQSSLRDKEVGRKPAMCAECARRQQRRVEPSLHELEAVQKVVQMRWGPCTK